MRPFRVGLSLLALYGVVSTGWGAEGAPATQAAVSADPGDAAADGIVPLGLDGRPLNVDFESGTLVGWRAEGEAFADQPVRGDTVHARRVDMHSGHQGEWWVGTYERRGDAPQGTLTSAPFRVTHPFASFRVAGGRSEDTRVELVEQPSGRVVFEISGENSETLRSIVVDLSAWQGHEMVIRLVDASGGGWGHLNFDHFRFHEARPSLADERRALPLDVLDHAGLDPEAAARAMTVPDGFHVSLFAGEPDVQQPVAMAIDDRGRVWVAEAYSYPWRAKEGEERDRILIFTDRDGDGRFDERQIFAEKLNLISGLEVGFGGVWVGAAPYLLFIPDRDGDDRPDGPPEVVLDGFGLQDTHETLNAFTWGPDGWLYGCHGVFTHSLVGRPGTPKAQRTALNAGIWRYHPTQQRFEVFAHGTSNPWGVDFDARGEAFCTACVIPHLFHVIQGARYQRQAGQHFNRYTYDDIQTIADHVHWLGDAGPHAANNRSDAAGGGHAHAGAMIYQGQTWPAEYRGRIFMHNIHGARVNSDLLEPRGSGFVGRHGPDFLLAHDSWSQMLSLQTGPDGQVYVIDWYDANQCHRLETDIHDRSNGRVFKISYRTARVAAVDLTRATDAELIALQTSDSPWHVRHARRRLQERGPNAEAHARLEQVFDQATDEVHALHALWALHVTAGLNEAIVLRALDHASPHVRGWTLQLAHETAPAGDAIRKRMLTLATSDVSPVVRRYLASALQRMPLEARWELLAALVAHSEDAADQNLPLMYWYAAEPLAELSPERALALVEQGRLPVLVGYMVRRIAEPGTPEVLADLVAALARQEDAARQRLFLEGIRTAVRGRRKLPMPAAWPAASARLLASSDPAVHDAARALAVTFGDPAVLTELRTVLSDAKADVAARGAALEALLAIKDSELPPVLQRMLNEPALAGAALRGLATYDHLDTPQAVLEVYPSLETNDRRQALFTLASRPTYAERLLDAIAAGEISGADVTADVVRQLRNLHDPALARRLTEVWGIVRDSPQDKARLIAETIKQLQSTSEAPGDPWLGRAVFARTCQQCHKLFGTGGEVGPELTGSNRANLEYVLSNVLDPSAVMAKEYLPTVLALADGRVVTGIVKQETPAALTVVTANSTEVIPLAEVAERALSDKSMMPDDLLKPLGEAEVRALVAYLASPVQVPKLAASGPAIDLLASSDIPRWEGDPQVWKVSDQEARALLASPAALQSRLRSDLAAADFRLSFELQLTGKDAQVALRFRGEPLPDGQLGGYLLGLGPGVWGRLSEEPGRGTLASPATVPAPVPSDWNTVSIECVGSAIRVSFNGQSCTVLNDAAGSRRGVLAWELPAGTAGEVQLRRLHFELLTENGQPAALPARAAQATEPDDRSPTP